MTATSDDTAHDLVVGQVVAGRYVIDRPLGEGGMGVVYLANDRSLGSGRRVALKILARRFVGRPARERRFANEARFAGRLPTHTNLATTLDAGRIEDGRPYIAMEYVDGPAINGLKIVTGRAIPPLEVCRMARGVADALRVVHQAGLVHRDLTPTNILVTTMAGEWVPKLIDFSHAAAVDGPRLELGHPERITQPNETPGTSGYMPPEQVSNAYPAPSMDVFAFGVVLWELLAERFAYRQRDRDDYFARQRQAPQGPPPLAEVRGGLPVALYRLIDDCTDLEPSRRPRCEEIVERLDGIIWGLARGDKNEAARTLSAGMNAAGPMPIAVGSRSLLRTEPEDEDGVEERPRRALLVAVALVTVLVTVGIVAWLWLREDEEHEARDESLPAMEETETKGVPAPAVRVSDEPPPAVATTGAPEPEVDAKPSPEPKIDVPPPAEEPVEDVGTVEELEASEPEPTTRTDAQPSRRSASAVRESAECVALRAAADAARERLDWNEVLSLTKQSRCWTAKTRARLRVRALLDLGRYKQCVREFGNSRDPAVKEAADVCKESLNP